MAEIVGVTEDQRQRRRLALPKRDLRLPDGRSLRRILGYDLSKIPSNDATRNGFLASGGWMHAPSGLIISAGIEDTGRWGPLLHVSMSYGDHDPLWEEIKAVRELFFPLDMDTAMILPRQADYVAVHPHCFHVWQLPEYWGLR